MLAKEAELLIGDMAVGLPDDELADEFFEVVGVELLRSIGESLVGVGVDFDHEAVETEVEGGLGEVEEGFTATGDVAGVAEDGDVGHGAAELYGHFPKGVVAIAAILEDIEATMDGHDVADACLTAAFDGAHPELDVGAGGVFDEHGNIGASEGGSELLNHEGVGSSASTNPNGFYAVAESRLDMGWEEDLAAEGDALFLAHPFESLLAETLEAARPGAGLPHAAAYHVDLRHGAEALHDLVELLATFDATGSGDDIGLLWVHVEVTQVVRIYCVGRNVFYATCLGQNGTRLASSH